MPIVTAIKNFRLEGKDYKPGDKLKVTYTKANDLAFLGLIKSILRPIFDKMIRSPERSK